MKKYLLSLLFVLSASIIGQLLYDKLEPANLIMLYLAAVLFSSFLLGRGPAILSSITGVITFDVLFVPPRFRLSVEDTQYFITFIGFLCVGLLISELVAQLRNRTISAVSNERKAIALYRLSHDLSKGMNIDVIHTIIKQAVRSVLRSDCTFFLESDGHFKQTDPYAQNVDPDEAAKRWSYQNGQCSGHGTPLWPDANMAYFPVSSGIKVQGVIGILGNNSTLIWTQENRQWTETLANQTAIALERVFLFEETKTIEIVREKERLQSVLLNSLSHDLRTPMVAITGTLSHLAHVHTSPLTVAEYEMIDNASKEAGRLNKLVTQWLDMARAESGGFKIERTSCDLKDLVGVALKEAESTIEGRVVTVDIPSDMPDINIDFPLFLKAFSNILDNAAKFSAPGSPISITASNNGDAVTLDVTDHGIGIPEEQRDRIFNKFYRTPQSSGIPGMGLGLSISRAIITAHEGEITVHDGKDKGTTFRINIPVQFIAGKKVS